LSSGYLYDTDIDRCIKVYDTIKNYVASSQACQAGRASLVKVDSYQMWIFVKNNIGMCLNCSGGTFKDAKEVIRNRKSKKGRKQNGQQMVMGYGV
jgi:hypothetical protein